MIEEKSDECQLLKEQVEKMYREK